MERLNKLKKEEEKALKAMERATQKYKKTKEKREELEKENLYDLFKDTGISLEEYTALIRGTNVKKKEANINSNKSEVKNEDIK